MADIVALPASVIDLMAAGEVIDSPAAVVRESAENAIDAGASRITVDIYPQRWQVRLADNGAGMSLDDLQQAATPHSTSKIQTLTDLQQVMSLGFRGEALHSLAQLAELAIASRTGESQTGWQVWYSTTGTVLDQEPVAIAPGTIVTVSHLFANWETRRQALPSLSAQLKLVQLTIYQLALCHPHITWQVQQNDQPWFTLYSGKNARFILPQILREVHSEDLVEWQTELNYSPADSVTETSAPASLAIVLGLPDRCHRRRPDWVKIAINGRCIQFPELEQLVIQTLRRTLPRDRFPVCFVHLQADPTTIDWNRHPAKSDVYLKHLEQWRDRLVTAIHEALQLKPEALPESLYASRVGQLLKTAEAEQGYNVNRQITANSAAHLSSESVTPLRAVAQLHNTYIIVEHPGGIWLVEQHIAHERVLFEQLCDRWSIQPLGTPILLDHLTPHQIEQLTRLELDIEPFGEQIWAIRSAPAPLIERDDCPDALREISLGGDMQTAQVAIACRTAIRNGTPLTLSEMQQLIQQWQQTRNPRTCPHGRPICLNLEESSLSRFFRRHWVIGKSHGI
ncbi:MAG TPA: DNA mismatch repair endonuclease MutL [Leptolyngbyaceae cyanobacterium M33_DOE_097]|uniref:DNA mismatch repair protein MutL n=1 Tax=Oscillatoriales cyanobacterium SpSt-418 TaxID=2282169 RepID=A0A7C3PHH3_9CYAN|nr:DNA mismatch repair endonuclease MutL [Leptolyngbyaceae cyanobacterium M33_DOE_097]